MGSDSIGVLGRSPPLQGGAGGLEADSKNEGTGPGRGGAELRRGVATMLMPHSVPTMCLALNPMEP